jgi:hypothetical protein
MPLKMNLLGAAIASFSVHGIANADTRLTMEETMVISLPGSDAPPQESRTEYTLWMGSDRTARIGADIRTVVRLDRGETYMIDDAAGSVTVMEFEGLPESVGNVPRVEKTGETRAIRDWTAERYEVTFEIAPGEMGRMTLWVSDDIDVNVDAYRALYRSMDGGDGLMTAIADLPGFPVVSEIDVGIASGTTTLLAVSEESPPDGTYDLPGGYERR